MIEGLPLPIGPAWCAADAARLDADLRHVRFAMSINGTAVDLSRYPYVRRRLLDGRECAWVGIASARQRASRNAFVYTITPADGAPPTIRRVRVDATVVFKDP